MKLGLCLLLVLLFSSANAVIDTSHVGWEQHVGTQLPLQLKFNDSTGRVVALNHYFGRVPVVMVFVYFSCPELCPEVLQGVKEALQASGLVTGHDYELLAISIDPRDTPAQAAERKAHLIADTATRTNVHFLTTPTNAAAELTRIAGFNYGYDAEHGQFAHAAGFLVADAHGAISRYFFGVRYQADHVRKAIDSAAAFRPGSIAERLLLLCYHFDATQGRYSLAVMNLMRMFVLFALVVGGATWWWLVRQKRKVH